MKIVGAVFGHIMARKSTVTMKIVGVDNHARETVRDILVAENVPEHFAIEICELLNKAHNIGDMAGTYYRALPDDYRLSLGMENLI